jgi:hypothetical protein
MSNTITPVRVFISSPGDLAAEREVVKEVLAELDRSPVFRDRYKLIPYAWEDGTPPVAGLHAQEMDEGYGSMGDLVRGKRRRTMKVAPTAAGTHYRSGDRSGAHRCS